MTSDDGIWNDRLGVTPLFPATEFPPPSAMVDVEVGADSRCGRGRTLNDDHFLILRLGRSQETLKTNLTDDGITARFDEYGYAMIVADGIGPAGAAAPTSQMAIATLVYLVRQFGKWNLRIDETIAREIMTRAERFYRHVDSTIVHERRMHERPIDQTTLTATFGAGRDLFFAHVGHSRAYLSRAGQLWRLTRDHTIGRNGSSEVAVAPLVDVNKAGTDMKHILINTIGMKGSFGPTIDLERFRLEHDDRVLVCTNGLTDMVDEKTIGEVIGTDQPADDQCRLLADLASDAGGEDDVTVLVTRYRMRP
jgi:protein phosphatase